MLNFIQFVSTASALVEALSSLAEHIQGLQKSFGPVASFIRPQVSYENLLLDLTFDIGEGRRPKATILRTQKVRFLVPDEGVIRELAWGRGEQLKEFSVEGAKLVGTRFEGSRTVLLLGLDHRPDKGEVATVRTKRIVANAVAGRDGYAEASLERPTRRLAVAVRFPKHRPPVRAHLVTSPPRLPARRLRCRYGADGRPYISWTTRRPERYVTYSFRWRW
jgi:hypothetical protein